MPVHTIDVFELDEHRPYLLKFALLQLRRREVAENLVQEAYTAAVREVNGFTGDCSVRGWLTGFLLNRIADYRRGAGGAESRKADPAPDSDEREAAPLFHADGSHARAPSLWPDIEGSLGDHRFFAALEACLDRLPEPTANVFLLREMIGLPIEEICRQMGISAVHCLARLHRARMRLRACLEESWFTSGRSSDVRSRDRGAR
jgi:RNA polymerase sigma-70 factor (ECF subfamily)